VIRTGSLYPETINSGTTNKKAFLAFFGVGDKISVAFFLKGENMPVQEIVVLDFGGQYNWLIARRIRDLGVFSRLLPHDTSLASITKGHNVVGIILSGSHDSVRNDKHLSMDERIFSSHIPVLGICYGMQLMALSFGGEVGFASKAEYGKQMLSVLSLDSPLLSGIGHQTEVFMSHKDIVTGLPKDFLLDASAPNSPIAAMHHSSLPLYGVQFHPEVTHTIKGMKILDNFITNICHVSDKSWHMDSFANTKIDEIHESVGNQKVLLGLSGGVDSTVTALLIHKAIGQNLTCVFVDHGLLRKNEVGEVRESLEGFGLSVIVVDAKKRFLDKLKNVCDPEEKRKIIGTEFVRVFEEKANELGHFSFLAQGTLYTDKVESGVGNAATIKSHHNVGGLPEKMNMRLLEPLDTLFKDEVRKLGLSMGLPESIVGRQPFPGPGLAIRIIGEITEDKIRLVKESDAILREEIKKAGLDKDIWQYFTVLSDTRTVGVVGDERTYGNTVAIRVVTSVDGMTADWAKIPYAVLDKISIRITNEISEISRVVYDITSKPPGTIEWE